MSLQDNVKLRQTLHARFQEISLMQAVGEKDTGDFYRERESFTQCRMNSS